MTYLCDRCGTKTEVWFGSFVFSREDESDQPDSPIHSDKTRYHLCQRCKDVVRDGIENSNPNP